MFKTILKYLKDMLTDDAGRMSAGRGMLFAGNIISGIIAFTIVWTSNDYDKINIATVLLTAITSISGTFAFVFSKLSDARVEIEIDGKKYSYENIKEKEEYEKIK